MKAQDIEEIAQAADQAISGAIKQGFQESFAKLNKPKFNMNANLIALIGVIVAVGLFAYLIVAAINNNTNTVKDTSTMTQAAIVDLATTTDNNAADIITGIDGVQNAVGEIKTSVGGLIESNTANTQKLAEVAKKQDSIVYLLNKASNAQMGKFQDCAIREAGKNKGFADQSTMRASLIFCTKFLK